MSAILFFCVKHIDVMLGFLAACGLIASGERLGIHPWIYLIASVLFLSVIGFAMTLRDSALTEAGKRIAGEMCEKECGQSFESGVELGQWIERSKQKNAESVKKEETAR